MKGSIDSIETFGLVDGPGIRTVVFLNSCSLRCKFCHNPEMWVLKENNYSVTDIVKKVLRSKPYFKDEGGVTFSGGEPLIQWKFVMECAKALKREGIHVAIDTAGISDDVDMELFKYVDLVLLDVKHINREGYMDVTGRDYYDRYMEFLRNLNSSNVPVWIRQVIVPGVHDNKEYIYGLSKFIRDNIKNVERIDFLPYHRLGREKYVKMNISYPYEDKNDMDKDLCDKLYKEFLEDYNK